MATLLRRRDLKWLTEFQHRSAMSSRSIWPPTRTSTRPKPTLRHSPTAVLRGLQADELADDIIGQFVNPDGRLSGSNIDIELGAERPG